METYGKILVIATPVFLLFVLFEKWYGWYRDKTRMRSMDTISSLASGITNTTKDVLGLSVILYSYGWMLSNFAIVHVHTSVLAYIIAFFALDFAGYWVHRIDHVVNIFWNSHIIHHSSEEFDLACALRQSISSVVKIFTIFALPAALLGVPEAVIAVVAPLHLFAQFWYHTVHINKMGWLEKIIVTPSHHRVHHAINKQYIDKNFGQIFIFWDRMFGTFQQEIAGLKTVYGITHPVRTWNPVKINFKHIGGIFFDAWHTKNFADKFRIWLMPTGWRPADVAEKYPRYKIDDPHEFEKYNTGDSVQLAVWSWFQLAVLLCFLTWLFGNIAAIGSPQIFLYGAFIFLFVYATAELMDGSRYALYWEAAKCIFGGSMLFFYGGWFGAEKYLQAIPFILSGYFIASLAGVAWLSVVLKQPAVRTQMQVQTAE